MGTKIRPRSVRASKDPDVPASRELGDLALTGLRRGRGREGGEALEGGLGGEVLGLLGRAEPAALVRRVVHFAVDGDGGAEPQRVGRPLALVGVVRRRPPPLLAQLIQLRLEHCRGRLGPGLSRWGILRGYRSL